jgi:hypothetical protein
VTRSLKGAKKRFEDAELGSPVAVKYRFLRSAGRPSVGRGEDEKLSTAQRGRLPFTAAWQPRNSTASLGKFDKIRRRTRRRRLAVTVRKRKLETLPTGSGSHG